MFRIAFLVTLVLACHGAPTRPTFVRDFAADYELTSKGQVLQSEKLAMATDTMMVAMTANYTVPFGKIINQIIDCKNQVMLMAEPFFDEEICYKEPNADMSPAQCFEIYSGQVFSMSEYNLTTYAGSSSVNGKAVQKWSYNTSSTRHERITIAGKTYNATVTMKMTTSFYVTATGNLLQRDLSESEDITGIPNPIHNQFDYVYLFKNYMSPAPASAFNPPNGVTCLPTENAGATHLADYMRVRAGLKRVDGMMNDVNVIRQINDAKLGWTAGPTSLLDGRPIRDAMKLMGTHPSVRLSLEPRVESVSDFGAIPASFDARTQWSMCESIGTIRNQGNCGSCWAFGATESLEDRICINSKGASKIKLAPEFITDCDTTDSGCGGGFLDNAWRFLEKKGLVPETCDPYQHCPYPPFPNCTKPSGAESFRGQVGACPTKCSDGTPFSKMYTAKTAYAVAKPGDVMTMQKEIMANGPIEVAFFVYSDFMNYQSGVYVRSKTAQGPLGGHAVKILGWGTEGGLPYWLVANSWSPNWGDKGFFKIIRGKNECGIETTPAAGEPNMMIW